MHGSEVGHASTGRAYSAAVRALKQKGAQQNNSIVSSGGGGIIIPKALVKSKKNNQNVTIQGLLNLKNQNGAGNFRTIQGKSSQSSQSTSKANVGTLSLGENPRKSQQMAQSTSGSANLTFLSGSGQPTNFKALKMRASEYEGGRNKSPSLSKSLMSEQVAQVVSLKDRDSIDTVVVGPRLNNFAQQPHSQMSRQRETLVEDGEVIG